ncbi:magnesium transporter [Mycoplasmopsis agassizii]|uniref:Magnesium transporter MgtE n=1 Tax=Mycoplasmopsis agassizii TaxID=33922 RepID=A0A269TKI3_9BACT|nr:magnesium transporter [Mycoplasmopsis agassizii]PAK21285.1 magnesium transporter [Mycoplasmopsis agassizii]
MQNIKDIETKKINTKVLDLNKTNLFDESWINLEKDELAKLFIIFIKRQNKNQLNLLIEQLSDAAIEDAFLSLNKSVQITFLRIIKINLAADIFEQLDESIQAELFFDFSEEFSLNLLKAMTAIKITNLLDFFEEDVQRKNIILKRLENTEKAENVAKILKYEDEQAGSIMQVEISILYDSDTIANALDKIKKDYIGDKEIGHYFFVVNENKELVGAVTLEDMIFDEDNNKNTLISDLLFVVEGVYDTDSLEKAVQLYGQQNMSALPVINKEKQLVGIIDSENMFDVARELATEDIYQAVGIKVEDASKPYLKTKIIDIVKSRFFWLALLLIGSTFSQILIQVFVDISSQTINLWVSSLILSGLVPVLTDAAGNAGSQSIATITRAYALGEFKKVKLWKIYKKEFFVAVIIGAIVFVINAVRLSIYFLASQFLLTNPASALILIFASSTALFLVLIMAKFLGTFIPLLMLKLKRDPAAASSPILATLSDGLSTAIFFGITISLFLIINSLVILPLI